MQNAQEIYAQIESLGKPENYKAGETIYVPDKIGDSFYFIREGRVKISYLDPSGRRLTLAILKAGDFFGEMAFVDWYRALEARALEDSIILAIDCRRFWSAAKGKPDAMLKLVVLFLRRIQRAQQRLKELAFNDLEACLARTLLRLSREHGRRADGDIQIELRLTHQELSELVGSSRESATVALNRLEREGLLEKRGFSVIIKDKAGLKRRAAL